MCLLVLCLMNSLWVLLQTLAVWSVKALQVLSPCASISECGNEADIKVLEQAQISQGANLGLNSLSQGIIA